MRKSKTKRNYRLEALETRRMLTCDVAPLEMETILVGDGAARAEVEYEIECEHGSAEIEFSIELRNVEPGSTHDVMVDGTTVGTVTANDNGKAKLELTNHPDDHDESPLPENFPTITADTPIQIGDILSGTFATGLTDDHDSDEDEISDDLDDDMDDDSHDDMDDDSHDDMDDDPHGHESEFGGLLVGAGTESGRFELEQEDSGWELEIHVSGAQPGSVHDVSVDGVIIGQLQIRDSGRAEFELHSDSIVVSEQSVITVGTILSGTVVDLSGSADFNSDGEINADDVDDLFTKIASGTSDKKYDLDGNQVVDDADMTAMLDVVMDAVVGDVNFDGVFDSADLVQLFQIGQYEDAAVGNSSWVAGDWNGDHDFDSQDLVYAFQNGQYQTFAASADVASSIQTMTQIGKNRSR